MRKIHWAVLALGVVVGLMPACGPTMAEDGVSAPGASVEAPKVGPADANLGAQPAPPKAKIAKTLLAIPACSVRYLAAKVSRKLDGRKWVDFRREECGQSDTHAVFPETVAQKYSGEDPEKARIHTCADQFAANKATDSNGGMRWVDPNGGYYAECISRLRS